MGTTSNFARAFCGLTISMSWSPKNRMRFQAGRLYRQGDDSHVDRAVLQLLDDLVAEVAINTDLHAGIQMTVLGKYVRQYVQAGRLIGANHQRAARAGALIRYGKQRLIPHLQQPLGVGK